MQSHNILECINREDVTLILSIAIIDYLNFIENISYNIFETKEELKNNLQWNSINYKEQMVINVGKMQ